ncbi:MAG: hypothetical protein HY236_05870 [Acidobacteria bacterium]|nr:hypothetical protein [Acidobacteriota bacterium]
MKKLFLITVVSLLLITPRARAQFAGTGTTTVSVTVAAEAAIRVDTSTTSLTTTGTIFNDYTGTTSFTYKVRTTASTGSGSITLKVTSDFSPSNGPSVGSPPTGGDKLAYTCTVSAPGTACSGPLTSSISSETNVAGFGANAHSTMAGNSGSTAWTLTNDPLYETGAYSATVRYTISAT